MPPLELVRNSLAPGTPTQTPAEIALAQYQAKLSELEGKHAEIMSAIPGLFELGGEAAVIREQDRAMQLENKVKRMRDNVAMQRSLVEAERLRAQDSERNRVRHLVREHGDSVVEVSRKLQANLEEQLRLIKDLRAADDRFSAAVAACTAETFDRAYSAGINHRIAIALYAISGDETRKRPTLDNAYELRERGLHDLPRQAQEHVTMAMSAVTK